MIEKQLLNAMIPIIDNLNDIEKKIAEVSKMEGPQGQPGEQGIAGADAIAPEATEIADVIKADEAFIEVLRGSKGDTGESGANGKDAEELKAESVAEVLQHDEWFLHNVKGRPGDIGEAGPQGEAGANGADGKNADVVEVAKSVILEEEFLTIHVEAVKSLIAAKFEEEMNEVEAILYG